MRTSMPYLSVFRFDIEYDLDGDADRITLQNLTKEFTLSVWFE